jgi:hypothetical protein
MSIKNKMLTYIAPTFALASCVFWVDLIVKQNKDNSLKSIKYFSKNTIESLCEKNIYSQYKMKDTNEINYFIKIESIKGFAANYNDIWCETNFTVSQHDINGDTIDLPKEIKYFNLKNITFSSSIEVSKGDISSALLKHKSPINNEFLL